MTRAPDEHKSVEFSYDLAHRFWRHVPIGADGCWEWIGYRHAKSGYGLIEDHGVRYLAHRISWVLKTRKDPGRRCILHRCDNPPCVRPSHLFIGTRRDNTQDMWAKGRQVIPLGRENGMAKLCAEDIPEIRQMLAQGFSLSRVGRRFGVHKETIRAVSVGITWKHVPTKEGLRHA